MLKCIKLFNTTFFNLLYYKIEKYEHNHHNVPGRNISIIIILYII